MSASARGKTSGKSIPPVAIAIALTILFLFVAWRAWVAFGPLQAGPLPPPPTQDINFVQQKATECQGDFSKLSAADQAKVQQITHGWGPSAIASDWRKSHSKPAAP